MDPSQLFLPIYGPDIPKKLEQVHLYAFLLGKVKIAEKTLEQYEGPYQPYYISTTKFHIRRPPLGIFQMHKNIS